MRNGGILGGLFPDDGQDLAFRDLTTLGGAGSNGATTAGDVACVNGSSSEWATAAVIDTAPRPFRASKALR